MTFFFSGKIYIDGTGGASSKKKSTCVQAFSQLRIQQKNWVLKQLKLQPKPSDADFPTGTLLDSESELDDDKLERLEEGQVLRP